MISSKFNGIRNVIRAMAIAINVPTPNATARINTMFGMAGTCSARTTRSGSANVMMMPKINPMISGSANRFDLLSSIPIPSPMGVMATSAPNVNKPMPTTNKIAPNRNNTKVPGVIGVKVILNISTIAVIGRTDASDSKIFSINCFFNTKTTSPFRFP